MIEFPDYRIAIAGGVAVAAICVLGFILGPMPNVVRAVLFFLGGAILMHVVIDEVRRSKIAPPWVTYWAWVVIMGLCASNVAIAVIK